ncbi:MAG: hypothetical protein KC550_02425 [Nanoarchaeota archaeon]|nr:hypothetical protein [Nanoarchaeota archaeon]
MDKSKSIKLKANSKPNKINSIKSKTTSKMENKIKALGWKRNLNFIIESLKLSRKELFEFKSNIYSSILVQTFFYTIMFIFYFILYSNFIGTISLSLNDFILFVIFANTIHLFIGFIFWGKHLLYLIKSGEINIYLIRPINPFIFYNIRTLSVPAFLFMMINIFFISVILIYTKSNIFNFSFIFVFILLIILTLTISMFLDSLDFIRLGLSSPFQRIYYRAMEITRMYPSQFFDSFKYNLVLFLFQGYYLTSVLIPILNGRSISLYFNELLILVSIIFIFSLGTYLNWKYGLKNYEAFG